MSVRKKSVCVIDDHPMLREGVVKFINMQPDLWVEFEGGSTAEALKWAEGVDVILMDLTLRNEDGLALVKQLKALRPNLPVLIFSMHNELTFAPRSLDAGADGYLMKDVTPEAVIAALRTVLEGNIALSPRMTTRLLKAAFTEPLSFKEDPVVGHLSNRELHIFRQLGAGATPTELASALNISVKTIETHVANLKTKLGVTTSAELRKVAAQWICSQ